MPLLTTKLYLPRPRAKLVARPRLVARLDEARRVGVVSAPAGFGKTTLLSEWLAGCVRPAAWLSLDEGDNDLARFLTYMVTALQTVVPGVGAAVMRMIQSPPLPPVEMILAPLLNELADIPEPLIFVLDDYHLLDSRPVDQALVFFVEHLPAQVCLVIASREDPPLPLARLRARGELIELRAGDLRFTPDEAADFLNQVMGLRLAPAEASALSQRTEGWAAGLQLAAISIRGQADRAALIRSFTGSHHFVLDYLVEEVLQRQPEEIQSFLLRTAILERLSGPLCDAVVGSPPGCGVETLAELERANLFIVPLDDERRWYRYHHLFLELLRQRLRQSGLSAAEYHLRASRWYEDNGLEVEAFQHAAAADDVERAARLMEGKGVPLQFRGALAPVLHWLETLPEAILNARPALWVMYASTLSMTGQLAGVEAKLQAAEAALQGAELTPQVRNLIGHIAAIRAFLAAAQNQVETIIAQSQRALEYLHPNNLAVRAATTWKLGIAYHLQGEREAAGRAYAEAAEASRVSGNLVIQMAALSGLGAIQEAGNYLRLAFETYQSVLHLAGDPGAQATCDAHLGLARIFYEWNDLDAAGQHALRGVQLAQQIVPTDRLVTSRVVWARVRLARGDWTGAAAELAQAGQIARQYQFLQRLPGVITGQVLVALRQSDPASAAHWAQTAPLPLAQARVFLAQGDYSAALAALELARGQAEAKHWEDERLKGMVLQAAILQAQGEQDLAIQPVRAALALAEPGGFVRLFLDEGPAMADLLGEMVNRGEASPYVEKLLAAFAMEEKQPGPVSAHPSVPLLVDPLSQRELEVLQLIAAGLSNQEICERLFLALDTVKGCNRRIFEKLQVQRRTEAVARARELGLL